MTLTPILYAIPNYEPSNREVRRKMAQEMTRISEKFQAIENDFCDCVFGESDYTYDELYQKFLEWHNQMIEWHKRQRKYKLTKPNETGFHERYAPVERPYTQTKT
jgi:hypothetical protein